MALTPVLSSVVGWLRAGYPEGVPEHDYVPLFALLKRRLSDAEVGEIAVELSSTSSEAAIRHAITAVTAEPPSEEDVARVSARLARGGWPLADPA